jgi:hypothetical protein
MSENQASSPRRRPGPIGFNAESAVTSNQMPEAPNPGGMGRATTPRKETPKSSKQLNVAGPVVWGILGSIVTVLGVILVSVPIIFTGLGVCIASLMVSRMNKTQQRLRSDIRNDSNEERSK